MRNPHPGRRKSITISRSPSMHSAAELKQLKEAAAEAAAAQVTDGMIVGLGSGSTATLAVKALGLRVARGLRITGIPTSEDTAQLARELSIPLSTLGEHSRIDVTIDGADEVELGTLNLIKGLGGALLREKIVAAASRRLVIVVDQEKLVDRLGEHTPVPVEVTRFGWQRTAAALAALGCAPVRRYAGEEPFISDEGHFILDCQFGPIADPALLERRIADTVGTVESGLFIGRTSMVVAATTTGVEVLSPPPRTR